MAENLYPLIQLHYLDQQIAQLDNRIAVMPVQIQDLDRKLERYNREVQDRQSLIAANQKKRKDLEGDIALIEQKRSRYKEQLDTVKTNKEYTGLQHEIETVNGAIRQVEDQILVQMEEAEHLKMDLDKAQKEKAREEKVINEEKKLLQDQMDTLQKEADGLKGRRQGWVDQIPQELLEIYERTAHHRKGIAMAEARDAMCQVCQMRIRPQLFQEIKRNDTIITCESCSRILFFLAPGEKEKLQLQAQS
ncbi:MAG TPA: C4-type zinc ribbon domain-containing protein [Acidobacteriota bacterium]|nr:C4-type zinc ribbon domain-containing protein [Acidobacteriota bacterium]